MKDGDYIHTLDLEIPICKILSKENTKEHKTSWRPIQLAGEAIFFKWIEIKTWGISYQM